jgi:hypothetical protein
MSNIPEIPEGQEPSQESSTELFKIAGDVDPSASLETETDEVVAEEVVSQADWTETPKAHKPAHEQADKQTRKRREPPSLFWPLVLIGAGILLLLSNLGYIPWSSWSLVWRLWPVLIIALGVEVMVGRRTMAGALFSGLMMVIIIGGAVVLILFAQRIPILSEMAKPAEWRISEVEHALDDIEQAHVYINWDSPPGHLSALEDSSNLIEARIAHSGDLVFDVKTSGSKADVRLEQRNTGPGIPWRPFSGEESRWDVYLSPRALLDLDLDSGSGHCTFDLTELQLEKLFLDSGSGAVDLMLPGTRSFKATINSGSGAVKITIPQRVGVRVELDSGSGAFRPDERFRLVSGKTDDNGVWETKNWDEADVQIELVIDQGSGRVVIEE